MIQLGRQACVLRSSEQEHRPNNSFKPSPLRGLGAKPVLLGRAGLTQALGLQEQSQQSSGRAQETAAIRITHHAKAIARPVGAKFTFIDLQTAISLAPRSRSRSTARKRWQSKEQAPHVGQPARLRDTTRLSGMCTAPFRARATGLTIRSSRDRFAARLKW